MKALSLIITGKVQGVFFRYEAKKKADELKLAGWVKNCDDGSVEIFAQGDDKKLDELERWCAKGPPMARVDGVRIQPYNTSDISEFTIISEC